MPEETPEEITTGSHPPVSRSSIQMLDLAREFSAIRDQVLLALETVCASQCFILGPEVDRFERAAARACRVPHAAGCSSGTDALWLALAALRIGPGDAVITTPFSFFASVSSILRAGAVPVLADIDPLTFNLSAQAVSRRLTGPLPSGAHRFAAILPVHLYGQCADMDAFAAIASDHGISIIEDAAQAFGASWRSTRPDIQPGARAGSLGDIAAFSFYPTKNLSAYGDAGMVATRSAALDERVRMLRTHGMRRRYLHDEIGWNARMDAFQAAILEIKLRRLEAGNARRREIARLYDSLFQRAGLAADSIRSGLVLPHTDPRAEHIFHQYVIRAPRRDALRAFLADEGIGSEIYYPLPLHQQASLAFLGYHSGDFPESERAAAEVLALPIYPELRNDEVETVAAAIRRFYA